MIFIISGVRLDISSVKEAMKYWVVGVHVQFDRSTLLLGLYSCSSLLRLLDISF